jgi:hypothetical protein
VRLIKIFQNEIYNIGKYSFDTLPFHNGLKQGDALTPLLFSFATQGGIKKIQEIQAGLKPNVTCISS